MLDDFTDNTLRISFTLLSFLRECFPLVVPPFGEGDNKRLESKHEENMYHRALDQSQFSISGLGLCAWSR